MGFTDIVEKLGLFGLLVVESPLYAHVAVYQCSMTGGWLSPTHAVTRHLPARILTPVAML